jgi:hypothetical protein
VTADVVVGDPGCLAVEVAADGTLRVTVTD